MTSKNRIIGFTIIVSFILLFTGCVAMQGRQSRHTSSVVDFLYPHRTVAEEPSIPHLSLPLRVGIAFVPEAGTAGPIDHRLDRKDKMDLMERISKEFRDLPFVKGIELIPSDYLSHGGGFTNLDQIKTMYNIDVIALLAYDQVQHTDEGMLSFSYLTIIGSYVIKGEKNDTNTMVDAVLYDIASRKMLFRAPGTSHIKGSSTLVNLSEQLRKDSMEGFNKASDDLVLNLRDELDRFKEKIKQMPQEYNIVHKPGYTGGGSLGVVYSVILLILGGMGLWFKRKR